MTIKTYQELFHYTTFPVFATLRDTGEIIYKNFSCEKYLPKLSRRKLLKPFVFAQNFSGVGVVVLSEQSHYQTAVAFEDGEHSVFLLLSYLQSDDGVCVASQLFGQFGPSLTDFLAAVHISNSYKARGSVLSEKNVSLYTQIAQIHLYERDLSTYMSACLPSLMEAVLKRFEIVFSDFDYCMYAKIRENFPKFLHMDVDLRDVVFVLGRLLYLQMKLSKNRAVQVFLDTDVADSCHIFCITSPTNLSGLNDPSVDLVDWLLSFIPECKTEFVLLYKAGILTKENFVAEVDRFGNLSVQYRMPYKSPAYYIYSVDNPDIFLLQAIDGMLENLLEKLTGEDYKF